MMGYGSYGYVPSSSTSNLSALAPPFTVDRSAVPKPISNPLVDLNDSPYGVPLNPSLHNWLPSHYPNSRTDFFSNHTSEFDPFPSSDAFRYPGLEEIKSPNTHLSPVNPIAPAASSDAFLYGQCSDGIATSILEAKPYYPSYVPPATQGSTGPLVVPDDISYDWFSSSHAPALDGSSHNDYTQSSLDYTALWGDSWSRFGDWDHGKQVELDGSFCSKGSSVAGSSIYKNYMNQGNTREESSHIIDMLGWEKDGRCVSMEQSNDKSFSGSKPRIMPVEYSKSSLSDCTSVLPENHPEAPSYKLVTNSRNRQVPYSASYEKDMREHDASLSGSASFVTSSPSLVIRPPDVVTTISASNKGPLKDVNFRTDASDPDLHGNNPSYVNELHPLLSSEGKVRFDASQLRIHLDRNDPVSVESFSAKNKELSMDKSISEDALDQIFKAKSGVQISHTSSDGFNLPLEFTQAVNSVENSSESLDHYNPAVDSPCWKGAPIGCFSPFEASKAVSSQYLKTLESCNNSDFQLPQFFPFNIDDAVKLSSQNPIEKTVYHEIGSLENSLAPSPKRPSVANLTFSECRSDDAAKAGSFYSKESCGYEVQHSDKAFEPGKDDASPSQSTGYLDLKSLLTMQHLEESTVTSEKKHSSKTCVVDAGSNRNNPSRSGTSNVPFHGTEDSLSSLASVEDASAKLTKLHKADSTSKIDVQMLVNTIYNLSETLLFHSSNDSIELKEGDHEALKNVILNLHQCLLKGTEQKLPTPESLFPEQGTSQYLEELPKLHKEVSGDRPRLANEAAIIAQDQLDHQCLHEEKHHHIVSVNKNEKVSDSVCVKGDANMVKEDNMTQAIMKVLNDNFKFEEDMQPKSLLYKNLWLEAEAELCSINYKARYNRMKIEMEKSKLDKTKDVSENTMNEEKELRSKVSHEMNTVDKLAPEARGGLSPVISIQDTPSIPDVMSRYSILKDRIDHSNSVTDVEGPSSSKGYPDQADLNKVDQLASETAEEKSLTQDISIQNSPIIDTTCHADSVMARFHILKCWVENSNSVTAMDVEEPSSIDVIPDLINVDKLVHEATEVKGSPIPDVSTQNSPVSTLSRQTEDVESSVMARFHVLKHRIDNVNSMDVKRQEFPEVFHFGFAGESKHRPIIRDKSEDGSVDVTLAPVLQHHTADSSEGDLTVKEFYLCKDDSVIQPCQSNRFGDPLPAGWFDTTSDWEHVMKEDFEE